MTCKAYESRLEELEDYLEGRLDAARVKAVADHVVGCSACREALEVAGMSVRLMQIPEPVAAPSGAFWTRLLARVRAEEEKRGARRDFFGAMERLAWRMASAALLAVAILGSYVLARPPRPPAITPQQAEVFEEPDNPGNADDILVSLAARSNGSREPSR